MVRDEGTGVEAALACIAILRQRTAQQQPGPRLAQLLSHSSSPKLPPYPRKTKHPSPPSFSRVLSKDGAATVSSHRFVRHHTHQRYERMLLLAAT